MHSLENIQKFLSSQDLSFDTIKLLSQKEALELIKQTETQLSLSFAKFLECCFLDKHKYKYLPSTRLSLGFISWEELYDCYLAFMAGYLKYKA